MNTVHFIAIGGQSMSGIARILLSRGYKVTGSDIRSNALTEELEKMGAKVFIGHSSDNLGNPDLVVVSSAIHDDNPEVRLARERGIPTVHRMDMLLKAVEGNKLVAIAGSHGKTTTTSMISWVLKEAGLDPTFLIGGVIPGQGNSHIGKGDTAVFETDESDGSFLKVHADVAIATNIDDDHLDYWGSMESLQDGFFRFLNQSKVRIVCFDDQRLRYFASSNEDVLTYGFEEGSMWRVVHETCSGWGSTADILCEKEHVGRLQLAVPGRHSIQNALGALLVCKERGVAVEEGLRHLATYPGVKRRLERKGELQGILLLDDFAHHPREIKTSLQAIRDALPERRILVVYQPHRYSRTRLLKEEFGKAFINNADVVIITGVYAGPGESYEEGVSSSLISEAIERAGHPNVMYEPSLDEAVHSLVAEARKGDVLVTMGAGDVYKGCEYIERELKKRGE
jgi:UDP-N-acetylmuramate--alanine ligase